MQATNITVSATVANSSVHATNISITGGINQFYKATVSHNGDVPTADEQAIGSVGEEMVDSLKASQESLFSRGMDTDSWILASAVGDTTQILSMRGMSLGPAATINAYMATTSDNILGYGGRIDMFSCGVYSLKMADIDEASQLRIGSSGVSNLSDLCSTILDKLMEFYDSSKDTDNIVDKQAMDVQHNLNKEVLADVKLLFSNSKETFYPGTDGGDAFLQLCKDSESSSKDVTTRVLNAFMQRGGGMMSAIIQLCEEFLCVYVPDISSQGVGKIISKYEMVKDPEETIELDITSVTLSAGSSTVLPKTFTAINGSLLTTDSDVSKNTVKNYTVYPDTGELPAGSPRYVALPGWVHEFKYTMTPSGGGDDYSNGADVSKATEIVDKKEEAKKTYIKAKSSILTDLAKLHYCWSALEPAYMTITGAFKTGLTIGTRYTLKTSSGILLGKGALSRVQHTIGVQDTRGVAQTYLAFSHVEVGDYTLPNK